MSIEAKKRIPPPPKILPFARLEAGNRLAYRDHQGWLDYIVTIQDMSKDTPPLVEIEVSAAGSDITLDGSFIVNGLMLGTCSFDQLRSYGETHSKSGSNTDRHIDTPLEAVARPWFGNGDTMVLRTVFEDQLSVATYPAPLNIDLIDVS